MNFCDFCECNSCKTGEGWHDANITHALTSDGRWICAVCFLYDCCTSGPKRSPSGPCEDRECEHRPKIVGRWLAKGERDAEGS